MARIRALRPNSPITWSPVHHRKIMLRGRKQQVPGIRRMVAPWGKVRNSVIMAELTGKPLVSDRPSP